MYEKKREKEKKISRSTNGSRKKLREEVGKPKKSEVAKVL